MSDGDPRPRPQYGEYATPEEQRARIARPDTTDALAAGVHPAPESGSAAPVASEAPGAPASRAAAPATGWRLADRIVSIGLLVYGLFNVLFTTPRFFDFAGFANEYLAFLGVDESFSNFDAALVWGPIAGIVYVVGWLASALLTWWQLRRGRVAFWIPLVGALLTILVVAACLTVPLSGDPAFAEFIDRFSAGR